MTAFDATYVDPREGEPPAITVDLRQPGWRDVVREKAERDAAWLFYDQAALDEMGELFGESGPGMYAAVHSTAHFSGISMSIPREAFRDLQAVKRQRNILQRWYRRCLEQSVMALLRARQATRARRSRQHKQRLRQQ